MKLLLVHPETPHTFYSFHTALAFVSKRVGEPPLGLITVGAMLPSTWTKRLVDMNVTDLRDSDLRWADMVFVTGMNIQRPSFERVIRRCNQMGVTVVAGGPLATTAHEQFPGVDHFVLNEAELTLPSFLADLETGALRRVYSTKAYPDLSISPVPAWDLLDTAKYANMSLQYSRGCPFGCDFCSIATLNGRTPRTKGVRQFLDELSSLYESGWRGGVAIVDDNFIGSRTKVKTRLLPELVRWSREHDHPFEFTIEASIDLADDKVLTQLAVDAGVRNVFVGVETPNTASLAASGKRQNLERDLCASVHALQRMGLIVSAGFIVGFDQDTPEVFEAQRNFIQESGIATAMVGLLNAAPGTPLFERLESEKRLLRSPTGDNMDGSMNFVPKMEYQTLMRGYKDLLESIYAPKPYYQRVARFLREYEPPGQSAPRDLRSDAVAFAKTVWELGVKDTGRAHYWRLLGMGLVTEPRKLPIALTLAVFGLHFRQVVATV